MNAAEIALITPDVIADPMCYNLMPGGSGSYAGSVKRPKRLTLISRTGDEFTGTVAELSVAIGMPSKKIYGVAKGHREHYLGLRLAA